MLNAAECSKIKKVKWCLWILPSEFLFAQWQESGELGIEIENRLEIMEADREYRQCL